MDSEFTIAASYTVKETVRSDCLSVYIHNFSQLRQTRPPGDPYCSQELEDDKGIPTCLASLFPSAWTLPSSRLIDMCCCRTPQHSTGCKWTLCVYPNGAVNSDDNQLGLTIKLNSTPAVSG